MYIGGLLGRKSSVGDFCSWLSPGRNDAKVGGSWQSRRRKDFKGRCQLLVYRFKKLYIPSQMSPRWDVISLQSLVARSVPEMSREGG